MHDLMHDLAMQVGGEECVLIEAVAEYVNNNEKARHISLDVTDSASLQELLSTSIDRKKLRTFLSVNKKWSSVKIGEGECNLIFSNIRCLRVLDLHSLRANLVQQSSISKLKHLRYLDLSCNNVIEMLPNSITRLQNLQVLKLIGCLKLKQLPKNIKKLVNLRQLDILGCDSLTHMPRELGQLSCLQELSRFVVANQDNPVYKHSGGLGELHGFNNLRGKLEIANLQYVKNGASEFKAANLKDKHRLQSLSLVWKSNRYVDEEDEEGGDFEMSLEELRPHVNLKGLILNGNGRMKFPSWLSSLANLESIEFRNFNKCQHLPPLQQFPCLKTLWIYGLTHLEYIDCHEKAESASSVFAVPLETLYLSNCPNLKGWRRTPTSSSTVELPQFHCLSELCISYCSYLISVPPFPSLKKLTLHKTSIKILETIMKMTVSINAESNSSSSLKYININKIEDLELMSLPVELLQATTLLSFRFNYCHCCNLTSLPEWMAEFNTSDLHIVDCPQLSERCNNNMAEDWPKIAHIPTIWIDDKLIQENGSYKL